MTILDAFAVVALFRAEPAATEVRRLISSGGARLTAVGVAEVLDHLIRRIGTSEEEAVLDVAQLGLLDAVPIDARLGLAAGALRARHYHRTDRAVSLADCVAAEAARVLASQLATADPHLLELCRDEAIPVAPLPDSAGEQWSP